MSTAICALCHERDADTTVSYRPDYAENTGPFRRRGQRRDRLQIPVCTICRDRFSRWNRASRRVGCTGLLLLLLGLVGILVSTFAGSGSVGAAADWVTILPTALGIALLILVGPISWYIQHLEVKRISEWLETHRPSLWKEITTIPSEDAPPE